MKRKKSNSSSKKKKQTFLAVLTEIGKTVYYTAGDLGKRLVAWLKRIWKRFRALSMDKQRVVAALAVLVTSAQRRHFRLRQERRCRSGSVCAFERNGFRCSRTRIGNGGRCRGFHSSR